MSYVQQSLADSEFRQKAYRETTTIALSRGRRGQSAPPSGGPYSADPSVHGPFIAPDHADAFKQYKAATRDWSYVAIRPIAVKMASQPWRVGMKANQETKPEKRYRLKSLPNLFAKQMTEGMETLDDHQLLEILDNPNPFMSGWVLRYCTALSIYATGKAHWWVEPAGNTGQDKAASLRIWYLPTHWVTPMHAEGRPFAQWKVKPPHAPESESQIIPFDQMCYFNYPDPADPLGAMSPLQTQARAVNTDEEIQKSQFASMINGPRPGVILRAGRLPPPPGQTGQGPLPHLTPEQREQLQNACRMAYAGAMHHGDPFIVDGMIEGIEPWTTSPLDMDYPAGSELTKGRIMQGIGTSPLIAGQVEGANRATAIVAEEIFYGNVVNPVIELVSQVATNRIGGLYSKPGERGKLYLWIEKAEAFDADLKLQQLTLAAENKVVKVNELREALDLKPLEGEEGDKMVGQAEQEASQEHEATLAAQKPPPMAGPQRPGMPGQPKPAAGGMAKPKPKPKPKSVRRLERKLARMEKRLEAAPQQPQALDFFVEGLKSALS
jgi:phage portal protein BeeE